MILIAGAIIAGCSIILIFSPKSEYFLPIYALGLCIMISAIFVK